VGGTSSRGRRKRRALCDSALRYFVDGPLGNHCQHRALVRIRDIRGIPPFGVEHGVNEALGIRGWTRKDGFRLIGREAIAEASTKLTQCEFSP
jgi:hypothetical protein